MILHYLIALIGKLLGRNQFSILIYHQVFTEKDLMRPSEPDVATFSWQMALIKRFFTPLSLSEALEHKNKGTLPSDTICITFDDGYLNNLEVAAPILKQFGIPATVYIATGFSQGENMFNDRVFDLVANEELITLNVKALDEDSLSLSCIEQRIKAAHFVIGKIKYIPFEERKLIIDALYQENNIHSHARRMMNNEQILALAAQGIEIGAHTLDHPILQSLPLNQQRSQILQSKMMLEKLLGYKVKGFAYPNGKLNDDYSFDTRNLVEELGFEYAVSTNWGTTSKRSDHFQLKRFTPWDQSPLKFHLRLILNMLKKGK
jgi:peptidoglycan/xylan/chitin deacetylase (PgdA/CDA1 family)